MVSLPAGFESDFSDDDCEIVYSSVTSVKTQDCGNSQEKEIYKTNDISSRGNSENKNESTKLRSKNKSAYFRRKCLDFQSSQLLDDLRSAINHGNLSETKNILSKDIFVDTILKGNWSGLMYACASGHADIVLFLLENKADPNFHADMYTPLMACCAAKKSEADLLECCILLLKHGAKVNAHERHYTTPLIFAAREGYSLIVQLLLDHKAETSKQDNRGKTALAWAAAKGHGVIVRLLLEKGANANVLDEMGQSPIDLAYFNGFIEISSLLKKGLIDMDASDTDYKNLVPKQITDVTQESGFMSTKTVVTKANELDLFLSGISLGEFIPKFSEHQLNFNDFLVMDDSELEKIGISQVGVRKKILEACKSVHKRNWETTSLPNLKKNQFISCPDAIAMMANIAKHVKYISSSVKYIHQQIQSCPDMLELSQDSGNVHNLVDELDDSMANIKLLADDIQRLKLYLEKVQDNVQFKIADLVEEKSSHTRYTKFACFSFLIMSSVIAATVFVKYPNIFSSTLVRIYIRIVNPFPTIP